MDGFFFNIDVLGFGACNLRCPTCPVGNSPEVRNPKGLMDAQLLDRLLAKAVRECRVAGVGLYNWTEPLLHPRLDELIDVVHGHGLTCDLSTNLNSLRNMKKVLAKNPRYLRISNSGFTQEHYGETHRGGDVDAVKRNMRELIDIWRSLNCTTKIELHYHRYADNLDDEVLMRGYCTELGIDFVPVLAFFMPVEKLVAYLEDDAELASVTAEDRATMGKLIVPVPQAMAIVGAHAAKPCLLQEHQVTLDFEGNVQLCCATYDSARFTLCNFLDTPLEAIQQMKYGNSFCTRCMNHGIHVYYTAATAELNEAAAGNAPEAHRRMLLEQPAYCTE